MPTPLGRRLKVGLPADEVRELLLTERYAEEVRDDERTAHSAGISAVPCFVIDRKYGASGAQPPETLLSLAPKFGAQLLMPRLGEPAEPAHGGDVVPWWRLVDNPRESIAATAVTTLPAAMPWPID